MANTLLSPTIITKEALAVLHQKANFIGNIDRQYDDRYAKTGAKIGSDLKIRKPNQFTVRTGATIALQDVEEASVTLTMATQKGVDFSFSSVDLTLTIDDFSERYIKPAISVLAAALDADAFNMYKDVWNVYDGVGAANSFQNVNNMQKLLTDDLAPLDSRCAMMNTQSRVDVTADTKGLFQDSTSIKNQYLEGKLGRSLGFDYFETTIIPRHTTGTAVEGDSLYNINGTGQTGSTLVIDTGTTTFLIGDVITIAGCTRVHPETKVSTNVAQRFVVTANTGISATSLSISPAIVVTGAKQNVTASPTENGAITKLLGGASAAFNQDLMFHKSAFTFVTADLEDVNELGAWGAREVMDGISMRIARQYDITNDKVPCRIDVLYGYKSVRPELGARLCTR